MKVLSAVMRTPKRKFAVTTAALMLAGTGAAVAAEVGAADHSTEYNPIRPCRIVDTRTGLGGKTGKFANGETHVFNHVIVGTACGGDLGNGGGFTSVFNASVTATQPSAAGYVRIWNGTESEPGATFLNYPNSSPGGFGVVGPIQIDDDGSSVGDGDPAVFNVKNYGGPTHIVIDVFGAFGDN